jgi:allantoinase
VGVWRLIRMLDRLQIPGTFFTNARCVEEYPDAIRQIVTSGHDLAAHGYTQDQLLGCMTPDEQQRTIRHSVDLLESCGGRKITGWVSPVLAFTPETNGFLLQAGLKWTGDVTYADLPIHAARCHRRGSDERFCRQSRHARESARSVRCTEGHVRLSCRE